MSQVGATEFGMTALKSLGAGLAEASAASLSGPREQLAESLLRSALTRWEDPEVRPKLLATLTAATTSKEGAEQLRDFLYSQLFAQVGIALEDKPMDIEQVAEKLDVPAININAAAAQVWGVVLYRYVLEMEPIASASSEELIDLLSPTIQRYLLG
ncbi:hypothetical protein QIS99_30900 [Streptomyces sp. B-S-A8]|uniref:Tetracyclin repressor-like C-terminal domain-containing protein n=1 Tax=Streptomyces solicavernae TaxID=3043614 RepID=A0ABT6S1T0_9ACTN|nr:hypothetical protein [Streptomyces sp. B-S-A8]MDI3390570.1 hypothetical protein [Streptomyces sp. B-S-A8]